ncbi:MAG: hypothetical protein ACYCOR_13980 [Acidobacteriaceae bacterium]
MNDKQTSERQACARTSPGRRAVRSGFSVCLFIVVLAVFGWVMHRRLTQYDTPQQAIHQSTAIKACPTKRNPISVPSMGGFDAFAVFSLASALAAALKSRDNAEASLALRVRRDEFDQRAGARPWPSLAHFFFLPPPSLLSRL